MAMLEIKDIHKTFYTYDDKPRFHIGPFPRGNARRVRSALHVLNGVDLSVEKGDVVAILGPSGSGKTTLLRCLNFLETADSGTLVFDGESFDLGRISRADIARLRKKTAFVFQNYNLFRNKTALQNVTEGLIVARRMPKEQADEIGRRMLEKVGLADRADYYPRQLSGGQQQRVALGRALVAEPNLLLLDEPLSNLDAKLRESMRFEIKAIQRKLGISVVYVTHDQVEAMTMSDKVIVINDGIIQQVGPPMEIYRKPANQFVAAFVGKIDFIKGEAADGKINITGTDQYLDYDGELTGKVVVAIRPESIHLCKEGGKLHGMLDNKTFMGDVNDCYVRLPNGKGVRVIAPPETYDEHEIGEYIEINFDTFHVYADDGTDAATKIVT